MSWKYGNIIFDELAESGISQNEKNRDVSRTFYARYDRNVHVPSIEQQRIEIYFGVSVLPGTLTAYGPMPLTVKSVNMDPMSDGHGQWKITVKYGVWEMTRPQWGVPQYSINVSTSSVKKLFGIDVDTITRQGFAPVDFGGGIGFNGSSFDGVDVEFVAITETISALLPYSYAGPDFRNAMGILVGTVNAGPFLGAAPGEAFLKSATGSVKVVDQTPAFEVNYTIAYQPNNPQFAVPGLEGTLNKKGWDYVWSFKKQAPTDNNGPIIQRAYQANAVQVYNYTNFDVLGIDNAFAQGFTNLPEGYSLAGEYQKTMKNKGEGNA